MAKDGGSDITSILLMVGGAAAAYWYITSYGPNGAVSAGAVSWWNTWFGTTAALPPASTTTTPPATTPSGSSTATGVTPPTTPVTAPTPVVQFPANFSVTPDINNSLKGTILYNGVSVTLNVILGNAGQASGVVWNSQGQDVTSSLGPAVVTQIVQGFLAQSLVQPSTNPGPSGVSGIVQAFQMKANPGMGMAPSMSFGKGFAGGFGTRQRKSTPPLRQLLN
jgi:hypothetical protein